MRTLRKIAIIGMFLVWAALVLSPMVSAAGPGQGMQNQMISPSGSGGQVQGGATPPGAGQDTGPGNSGAPSGPPGGFGNVTGPDPSMNLLTAGNTTGGGPGNGPADNMTFGQPPFDTNSTAGNWTTFGQMPPPGVNNMTAAGGTMTPPSGANGNVTHGHHVPLNQSVNLTAGTPPDLPGNSPAQNTSQNLNDTDVIEAFLRWLTGKVQGSP